MSKRLAILMSIIALVIAGCARPSAPGATVAPATSVPPTGAPYPTPQPPDYWPTHDWRTSTPEEQGLDPVRLAGAFEQIAANHSNVHSVLVIRHGYLAVESYFRGYTAERTHELWSCTKSFMSTLIGIALAESAAGQAGGCGISGVDEPIKDFLPELITPRSDRRKQAITLEHLLTMRSGLSWPESQYNADSPQSPIYKMVRTSDWPAYVLGQPMTGEPGAAFNYSSGNAHVLSAILQKASGEQTKAYATTRLFGPLGIEDPAWSVDAAGNNIGGWGLQLTPATWPGSASSICTAARGTGNRSCRTVGWKRLPPSTCRWMKTGGTATSGGFTRSVPMRPKGWPASTSSWPLRKTWWPSSPPSSAPTPAPWRRA